MKVHFPLLQAILPACLIIPCALGQVNAGDPIRLPPVEVTAPRVIAADSEGPQLVEEYDPGDIQSSGAFSVEEFLENLPPADGDSPQLILIDGRPTYLDPNSLPVGMIARIEVSNDGSMPEYGAYSSGRIINIRLKKDYASTEVGAKYAGAFAGGGSQRTLRFAGAINRERWHAIYSLEVKDQRPLLAADRSFSRDQDHRAIGGRDLRLPWGQPAVVTSLDGPLNGLTRADGSPVVTALVPAGQDGSALTPIDFLPTPPEAGDDPAGQRRFNTSGYRWLLSPSNRRTLNLGFTLKLGENTELSLRGSHSRTPSERIGPPPVTAVSAGSRVPAAYNPFGQDVAIGLVHLEFGPVRRDDDSRRSQCGLELAGRLADGWKWEASAGHRFSRSDQTSTELDPALLTASLAADSPAARLNPFADGVVFPVNAAVYSSIQAERSDSSRASRNEVRLAFKGQLFNLPGGPTHLKLKAEYETRHDERLTTKILGAPPNFSDNHRRTADVSGTFTLPFIAAGNPRPIIRRLEVQTDGRMKLTDNGGRESKAELGVVWAPTKELFLRARYERGRELASRRTVAGSETLLGETLIDPRRGGEGVTAVRVFSRDSISARPEATEQYSMGATLEPSYLPGLRASLAWRVRHEQHRFQDEFAAQEVLNNEFAFAGRVIRLDPTADDDAIGQPGSVAEIDLTPGNTGRTKLSTLKLKLDFRPQRLLIPGQWRISVDAEHTLNAIHEVQPGVPFISDGGDRYPRWRLRSQFFWSLGPWNASLSVRYTGAIDPDPAAHNGVAAATTVDFNAGYRWQLRKPNAPSRNVTLTAGITNLFDQAPPFADNVSGFRGGSPLGRSYQLAITFEL